MSCAWVFIFNRVPGGGAVGMMKITVGSEGTRLLGKACKCFSRNPAQVNDMNEVVSSTSLWHKSSTP